MGEIYDQQPTIPVYVCYPSDQYAYLGGLAGSKFRFGPWSIYFDPPPIPTSECDWHFWHEDDDGAPDGSSRRSGSAASLLACCQEIDHLLDAMASDCRCTAPELGDCKGTRCPLRFKLEANHVS